MAQRHWNPAIKGIDMLTLEAIRERAKPIAEKYNIVSLELFGSYADGVADENSDADFLARFAAPVPSIFKVMGFREELSRSLGLPVDVVTLPLARPDKLRVSHTESIL
jgi:predicted nucleotidyltransferase